jgi:hypothetical protein
MAELGYPSFVAAVSLLRPTEKRIALTEETLP